MWYTYQSGAWQIHLGMCLSYKEGEKDMNKLIGEITVEHYGMITNVVNALLENGAKTATKFISPKLVIRASQRLYRGKLPPSNSRSIDIVLTIGAPNYEAREFIKACKKAKEPFPIKKIQLRFPPEKK
jgi:hypothetical protein